MNHITTFNLGVGALGEDRALVIHLLPGHVIINAVENGATVGTYAMTPGEWYDHLAN